jgi:hypothetical protein
MINPKTWLLEDGWKEKKKKKRAKNLGCFLDADVVFS